MNQLIIKKRNVCRSTSNYFNYVTLLHSSSLELLIPHNSLSSSSSDSPSLPSVIPPSSSCFCIQNNHKGLYTRVLQPYTCAFCFDICFFAAAAASQLVKNVGCSFMIHPTNFDALIRYSPSVNV